MKRYHYRTCYWKGKFSKCTIFDLWGCWWKICLHIWIYWSDFARMTILSRKSITECVCWSPLSSIWIYASVWDDHALSLWDWICWVLMNWFYGRWWSGLCYRDQCSIYLSNLSCYYQLSPLRISHNSLEIYYSRGIGRLACWLSGAVYSISWWVWNVPALYCTSWRSW